MTTEPPDLSDAPTGALQATLAVIVWHNRHGYAPTVRDVQDTLGFASVSTAYLHLVTARDWGLVTWRPGQVRTITATADGWAYLAPSTTDSLQAELDHCRAMLQDAYDQLSALRRPRVTGHPPDPDRTRV